MIVAGLGSELQLNNHSFDKNHQSSPFLKLPAETRNAIYTYASGGNIIHIHGLGECNSRIDRVRNTLCREPDMYTSVFKNGDAVADPDRYSRQGELENRPHHHCKWSETNEERYAVPLLLTCRQLYFEVQPIVYKRNTFLIDNYGTLECFYRRVHQNFHHMIHNVILHMDLCWEKYQQAWERIVGNTLVYHGRGFGIRHLKIIMLQDHRFVEPPYAKPSTAWLPNLCGLFVSTEDASEQKLFPNLKTCQVMITDHAVMDYQSDCSRNKLRANGIRGTELWTYEQKLQWADFFRTCLLGPHPDSKPFYSYLMHIHSCTD